MKRLSIILLAIISVTGGTLVFQWVTRPRLPFELKIVENIPKGASQASVVSTLGKPQKVHDFNGRTCWTYYRNTRSPVIHIDFDKDLLYEGYEVNERD